MRGERQGDHQQPRCVLVEPMDDTGTRYRRSLWKVIQQSVLQRARTLACAGVHGQTRWLVDDCDRLVEMHDFDRAVLRLDLLVAIGLGSEFDAIAELGSASGRGSVCQYV